MTLRSRRRSALPLLAAVGGGAVPSNGSAGGVRTGTDTAGPSGRRALSTGFPPAVFPHSGRPDPARPPVSSATHRSNK
eukprot:scaffold12949_cov67-Isochrysis_galbana.AAC.3